MFGDFDFTIEHISGSSNHVDGLSRRPDLEFNALVSSLHDDLVSDIRAA